MSITHVMYMEVRAFNNDKKQPSMLSMCSAKKNLPGEKNIIVEAPVFYTISSFVLAVHSLRKQQYYKENKT